MLITFPRSNFVSEIAKILSQKLMSCFWLSMSRNSKIMTYEKLFNIPHWTMLHFNYFVGSRRRNVKNDASRNFHNSLLSPFICHHGFIVSSQTPEDIIWTNEWIISNSLMMGMGSMRICTLGFGKYYDGFTWNS